jgi:hypothetical protein
MSDHNGEPSDLTPADDTGGELPPSGMSYAEIMAAVVETSNEPSSAVEEPLDTGLWPDSQMTDAEETALVDALRALPA